MGIFRINKNRGFENEIKNKLQKVDEYRSFSTLLHTEYIRLYIPAHKNINIPVLYV